MDAQLRPVPAPNAEEADLADRTRSFEDFYEATYRRLYTALCLVTGNRHEAEDIIRRPSFASSSDGSASRVSTTLTATSSGPR